MALLFTISSAITLAIAHNINYESRIVNGEPVSASLYPWMVSLRQQHQWTPTWRQQHQFCGASLIEITPPIILTAAHCVEMFSFNETDNTIRDTDGYIQQLYADINRTYDLADTTNDTYWTLNISLSDIHIHELWDGSATEGYDIALIIFNDFNFSQSGYNIDTDHYKTLLPLMTANSHDTECCAENEELTVIGYGNLVDDGASSPRLKRTQLNYVEPTVCAEYYLNATIMRVYNVSHPGVTDEELEAAGVTRSAFTVTVASWKNYIETNIVVSDTSVVCVIGDNTDVCQGDSGGPMFRVVDSKPEIIGAASFVIGDCNDGSPSAYTNVARYHDWIQKTISWQAYGVSYDPTQSPTKAPVSSSEDSDEGHYICGQGHFGYIMVIVVVMYLFV